MQMNANQLTKIPVEKLSDTLQFLIAENEIPLSDALKQVIDDVDAVCKKLLRDESAPAQPVIPEQPKPTISFYRDGIIAAAKWVENQRDAYDNEHGQSDPDTGAFEFGNDAQLEYSTTLSEIAEGIRSLHPTSAQPVSEPYKLPDGWKLVPIEPTAAMFHAFNDCDYGRKSMRERYIQMIKAAPARECENG